MYNFQSILKEKMKLLSNKVYFTIVMILILLFGGIIYFNSEEKLLEEDKIKVAYQNFLTKENQTAEKMFGKLTIDKSKNQLENLKLKKCQKIEGQYECIVFVKVNTIRGIQENEEKLILIQENNQEIILKKSILSK